MDLEFLSPIDDVVKMFVELGFNTKRHPGYYECSRRERNGRFDALLKDINPRTVYCDLHWDATIHFLFMGVDYRTRPRALYENELKPKLSERSTEHQIVGGLSWFERRNRAVVHGLRIRGFSQ